jgi:hypothetical protein
MAFTITKNFTIVQSGYVRPAPEPAPTQSISYYSVTSSITYNVSTTGNDTTGDGSSGSPWATLSGAIAGIRKKTIAPNVVTVTLQFSDGTYASSGVRDFPYRVIIKGNQSSPSNVYFTGFMEADRFGTLRTEYVRLFNTVAYNGGIFEIGTGTSITGTSNSHIYAADTGIFKIKANYSCSGNAHYHVNCDNGRIFYDPNITVTLTGTPSFGGQFCLCTNGGHIRFHQFYAGRTVFSGTANGQKYYNDRNSLIEVMGESTSYLPGSSAGSSANGALYI